MLTKTGILLLGVLCVIGNRDEEARHAIGFLTDEAAFHEARANLYEMQDAQRARMPQAAAAVAAAAAADNDAPNIGDRRIAIRQALINKYEIQNAGLYTYQQGTPTEVQTTLTQIRKANIYQDVPSSPSWLAFEKEALVPFIPEQLKNEFRSLEGDTVCAKMLGFWNNGIGYDTSTLALSDNAFTDLHHKACVLRNNIDGKAKEWHSEWEESFKAFINAIPTQKTYMRYCNGVRSLNSYKHDISTPFEYYEKNAAASQLWWHAVHNDTNTEYQQSRQRRFATLSTADFNNQLDALITEASNDRSGFSLFCCFAYLQHMKEDTTEQLKRKLEKIERIYKAAGQARIFAYAGYLRTHTDTSLSGCDMFPNDTRRGAVERLAFMEATIAHMKQALQAKYIASLAADLTTQEQRDNILMHFQATEGFNQRLTIIEEKYKMNFTLYEGHSYKPMLTRLLIGGVLVGGAGVALALGLPAIAALVGIPAVAYTSGFVHWLIHLFGAGLHKLITH